MAIICIPKKEANKLKQGIKNGDFDIAKLIEMTSSLRRAVFERYLSKDLAKFVNTEFEKAIASNKKTALAEWAEKTFKGKDGTKVRDITDRIQDLQDSELLDSGKEINMMEDLISEKLGVNITAKELEGIVEHTDKLKKLDTVNELGLPTIEYWKARKELMDYVNSLSPTHNLKVATSISGRAAMLTSFKSPLINITSNSIMDAFGKVVRRFEALTKGKPMISGLNNDFAIDYIKYANKVYQASGSDPSRMVTVKDDSKFLGEKVVHSEGKGVIRKVGKFNEDVIFKQLMGSPDVFFSALNFADSANVNSSIIARQEGLTGKEAKARALELLKDAVIFNPTTIQGQNIRSQAMEEAFYWTYTNDSVYSKAALEIRGFLNNITGDLSLGDNLIPFAKTPANVVGTMVDASGIKAIYDIWRVSKGIKTGDAEMVRKGIRKLVIAGFGILGAFILSKILKPDDYIGEYSSYNDKERSLIELKNGSYNSIKIGNKWISLDYFGLLGSPLVGFLEAERGVNAPDKAWKYFLGVAKQAIKIPGFETLRDSLDNVWDTVSDSDISPKTILSDAKASFVDFVSARVIPAIISDAAKAIDDTDREADTSTEKIMKKIPGIREKLDEKIDLFGKPINTENPLSTLFFGTRLKTYEGNHIVNELNRLSAQGELPSIGDIKYSSTRVKKLEEQIGKGEFNRFLTEFGQTWYDDLEELFDINSYQEATDSEKKKKIEKKKDNVLKNLLKDYGYTK